MSRTADSCTTLRAFSKRKETWLFAERLSMLQGFLVVLAIYFAAVAVVVINVARSRMAVTAECIKVKLLFCHLLSLLWPALISLCFWLPSSV